MSRHTEFIEQHIRDNAVNIAVHLRRVADEIERDANNTDDVLDIPSRVTHTLNWGIANTNADSLSAWAADLVRAREAESQMRD
ncbi:hypothetical protein [Tsukamurella paurometabola]|uniref:Uncharacterized protein n=1 Tax=Tsukamurella paurometabola TaxID=2061 RepID=A0ABS5NDM9_TSUPA|nr:hypothetical protein [Tsukamurella paurometabola]MBS4102391.1 hypothetical protein [Tsukamurella paurometabola]